jgi:predicted nucleic-acid-binding Zn-ribbon protein
MISNSSKAQVERKCPKCGSSEVTRSQRIDLTEKLLSLVNVYPYRCQKHTCKHRFESFGKQ